MKIFLDECVNKKMIPALKLVLPRHDFLVAGIDTAAGIKDIPLFAEVASRGVELFITTDIRQLRDPTRSDERNECRKQGLNWVGIPSVKGKGRMVLYGEMSYLVAGLELVARDVDSQPDPHFYLLNRGHDALGQVIQETGLL